MKANWDCPCCGNGNDSEYPAKSKAPNSTGDQLGIHSNTLLKKAMYDKLFANHKKSRRNDGFS
jgi:hypothetical protein